MATVKRSVYLVSEQQRNALLNYLKERPYQEVASGIQMLLNAPTAQVDVEMPEAYVSQDEQLQQEEALQEPVAVAA